MKKLFFFAAAMLAAMTINAKVININLNEAKEMSYTNCSATFGVTDGVLNVNYTTANAWDWAGVEFDLENLTEVLGIDFDFKGLTPNDWTAFVPYLRDSNGNRWWKDLDLSLSSADWVSQTNYLPDACYYDAGTTFGEAPFTKLGFIANPMAANETSSFALRNIKITVPGEETAIDNVNANVQATKVIRDGQVLIVRDGKTYNALGAEVK